MEPKLTILTPTRNQGEFLEQTIRSVMDQGYPELEYLILDGGSTDGTAEILQWWAEEAPGVLRFRSERDAGQIAALNEGIRVAAGEIIAFINSDDVYLPGAFSTVASYFAAHPEAQWVVGDCAVSEPTLEWTFRLKALAPVHRARWVSLLFNFINQPAVFLRTEFVRKVGEFNPAYPLAFDYEYWLRCLQFSLPGRIHRQLALFRVQPGSKSSTGYLQQFQESQEIARQYSQNPLTTLAQKGIAAIAGQVYRGRK